MGPFRPTGFTTAAVIAVLDHITEMMAENEFVLIISTDYTKAFDSIRHEAVADALLSLDMPDAIYNWLLEYLEDNSAVATINASVVQGSVIGPPKFIVTIADLQPISPKN